jgi:hypothetical protein
MPKLLPNGIGGSSGDSLVSVKPLQISGTVWYVDSQTGNASYTGKDRLHPLATLGAAVTASSAGDIIVCLSGHTEEVSAAIALASRRTIIGEGFSAGKPTVKLTLAHATADIFALATAAGGSQFRNLHFQPPGKAVTPGAASGSFIACDVANTPTSVIVKGCYFDHDQYCDGFGIRLRPTCNYWHVVNCVFTSTETSTTATNKPQPAMSISGAITGLYMDGCVFDGGTVGFDDGSDNPWAFDGSAAATTDFHCEQLSLLRGADMKLHANTTGWVNVQTSTGMAMVEW